MNMDVSHLTATISSRLIEAIYPPRCVLCKRPGFQQMDICHDCYQALPWIHNGCSQCALPLPVGNGHAVKCGKCLQNPLKLDHSLSLFEYEKDAVTLIHQLKFSEKLANSRLLGSMLADRVEQQMDAYPELLLPVPLFNKRLRKRGFNQSVEIARTASKRLNIPMEMHSVARVRDTKAQTGLDKKQRRKNIRGAFEVIQPLHAKHIAIIDDVVTTTSTANELAKVLKRTGVERVDVWSVARAV